MRAVRRLSRAHARYSSRAAELTPSRRASPLELSCLHHMPHGPSLLAPSPRRGGHAHSAILYRDVGAPVPAAPCGSRVRYLALTCRWRGCWWAACPVGLFQPSPPTTRHAAARTTGPHSPRHIAPCFRWHAAGPVPPLLGAHFGGSAHAPERGGTVLQPLHVADVCTRHDARPTAPRAHLPLRHTTRRAASASRNEPPRPSRAAATLPRQPLPPDLG